MEIGSFKDILQNYSKNQILSLFSNWFLPARLHNYFYVSLPLQVKYQYQVPVQSPIPILLSVPVPNPITVPVQSLFSFSSFPLQLVLQKGLGHIVCFDKNLGNLIWASHCGDTASHLTAVTKVLIETFPYLGSYTTPGYWHGLLVANSTPLTNLFLPPFL